MAERYYSSSNKEFHCIECGATARDLYKEYRCGSVKISHCWNEECQKVVDKYIEYEPTVIFLDTVLHKMQAYRHILYNREDIHKIVWKFAILCLICDTYLKWSQIYSHTDSQEEIDERIFYAPIEHIQFYMCFFICSIEASVAVSIVLLFTAIKSHCLKTCVYNVHNVFNALIISSYGKLLAIPAIIWGQTHSYICLALTQLFIYTSNSVALRATNFKWFEAIPLLAFATVVQSLLGSHLEAWILGTS